MSPHVEPLVRRIAHEPLRRALTVTRVVELSPTMRRVVLAGPDLEADFPFVPLAAADHVKVVLPDEDTGTLVMPEAGPAGLARPDGRPVVTRDYTPRAYDSAAGELTLDFVLHDHGPAGRWGLAAAPGDPLGVMGPRGSQVYPDRLGHYVLVADETGVPALERFLEELPAGTAVDAVVFSAGGRTGDLAAREGLDLRWENGDDLQTAAARAADLVGELELTEDSFVFGAGEASVMRALRTRLRRHPALSVDRIAVRGYWRVGVAGALPTD